MNNLKPTSVKYAEIAIWATIGVSSLAEVINRNRGVISPSNFMGMLVVYALICIVPYKIGRRSNAARYVYAVITAMSILMLMTNGISAGIPKLDIILSYLLIPVEVFILYNLFRDESSSWFSNQDNDRAKQLL